MKHILGSCVLSAARGGEVEGAGQSCEWIVPGTLWAPISENDGLFLVEGISALRLQPPACMVGCCSGGERPNKKGRFA